MNIRTERCPSCEADNETLTISTDGASCNYIDPCKTCNGSGFAVDGIDECPACGGSRGEPCGYEANR